MRTCGLLLFLLALVNSGCSVLLPAKRARCEKLVLTDSLRTEWGVRAPTPRAYVLAQGLVSPQEEQFLRNRARLDLIATRICNDRKIFMEDSLWGKTFQLSLTKGELPFSPDLFPPVDSLRAALPGDSIGKPVPYGYNALDTKASYIALAQLRIDGREIDIPAAALRDLLFPNFCETILPIRPIELYYDPDRGAAYLYIFGAYRPNELVDYAAAFRQSYLAKLIFDLDRGYVGRVVLRGHELEYYNWAFCPEFVGF